MFKSLFKMLLPLVATYFIDRYSKTGRIPTPKGLDKIFNRNRANTSTQNTTTETRRKDNFS